MRAEDRVEDVAAHVAERAGAEVEPLPPVARVVVAVADERPLGRDAEPQVPVEPRGHRVVLVGLRVRVAPRLAAPRVDFLHLPDRAVVDELHDELVLRARVNLNAHLRDELLLGGDFGEPAGLVDRLRQRLLAVDVQAAVHGAACAIGRVHVVRRRDVHRVEVLLLVEQHAVVVVDMEVGPAFLERRRGSSVGIDLGDGDELQVLAAATAS